MVFLKTLGVLLLGLFVGLIAIYLISSIGIGFRNIFDYYAFHLGTWDVPNGDIDYYYKEPTMEEDTNVFPLAKIIVKIFFKPIGFIFYGCR